MAALHAGSPTLVGYVRTFPGMALPDSGAMIVAQAES